MPSIDPIYSIENSRQIVSPGLVVFRPIVMANLRKMVSIAKDPARLRPHCKTHKMREIVQQELDLGIRKHKCATFAEAEMLADCGVQDIFLAYNLVGPNIQRAVRFREAFPGITFSVTADHPVPLQQLSTAMQQAGQTIDVLLDLDTGMHRTGIAAGSQASSLYEMIVRQPAVQPGGLHVYDGQNHQVELDSRRTAANDCWNTARGFRDELLQAGFPVPRIVIGGTGTFPCYAEHNDPSLELSPGTCVLHDAGYRKMFPDMHFQPAALILTRVISRPGGRLLTCDLGYKAVASDPPEQCRVEIPELPDARVAVQNEEHLVLETAHAENYEPGDELLAIPHHICPTSALHRLAWIVDGGKVIDRWEVIARDRWLKI